jgi:hypothetical protein
LLPNTPTNLSFYGWEDFTLNQFMNTVTVTSVYDASPSPSSRSYTALYITLGVFIVLLLAGAIVIIVIWKKKKLQRG